MSEINIPIRLSDGISAPFQSMASSVEKTFSSLQKLKGVMSSDFGKPITSIGNQTLRNKQYQDEHNRSIAEGATNASNLLNKVKGIAGAYLGMQGLKKVIDVGDSMANMNSSIGMISNGTKDTEANLKKIYDMSIRTRSSFTDNAKIVGKLGLLAKDAFKDNNELIAFSETMNKAFKVSGASIIEQTAAMHQLTQAMASGRLQGDEFRSILENAPMLAQAIQKELNGIDMKKASSEGLITADVIKRAMFNASDEINKRFAGLPVTFGDIMNVVKNVGIKTLTPLWEAFSRLWNNEKVQKFAIGIAYAFGVIGQIGAVAIDGIASAIGFLVDNMNIILPIVGTLVGAFLIYKGVLLATAVIKGVLAAAEAVHAGITIAWTIATGAMTMAQWGLNTALFACPITWIVLGIIALIAILFIVVGVINKVKGTHISAVGIMVGSIYALGTIIMNILKFIANLFLAVIESVVNLFIIMKGKVHNVFLSIAKVAAQITRAIANEFYDAGDAIGQAFVNGANMAIKAINWIVKALNKIPGVNLSEMSSISFTKSSRSLVKAMNNDIASIESQIKSNDNPSLWKAPQFEYGNIKGSFDKGYNIGEGLVNGAKDKFKDMKDGIKDVTDLMNGKGLSGALGGDNGLGGAGKALKDTAGNTKKIADNTEKSNLDVRYLREMAERQAINRYTTANINIQTQINNPMDDDIDGFVDKLNDKLIERMDRQTEGVYI